MIGASTTLATDEAKIKQVATNVWDVTSWPETDLAADLGWSAGWLLMALGMVKVTLIGLHHERKARGPIFKR